MAHVSDAKKKIVEAFVKLIRDYPVVGAIDLEGMPTAQLQNMRSTLRENNIVLLTSKRRLIKIALEYAKKDKPGVEEVIPHLTGMPALIFSKIDSFRLYKLLKQSKSEAPAKAGQVAPKDIEIKAGPTEFLPGPIIGELGAVGIKSGVDGGKVAIKEDSVVCKTGETISANLAGILIRLNIKPMEIGLNLTASFENKTIFKRDVLDIDEDKFLADLSNASSEAFNLSVEAGYLTKENTELIIQNVFYSCKALSEESGFMSDVVLEDMLTTAERGAKSLATESKIDVSADVSKEKASPKTGETKEVSATEEKKEEPKPEVEKTEVKEPEKPKEVHQAEEKPKKEEPTEVKEEKTEDTKKQEEVKDEKPEVKEEKALEEEKEIIKEEQNLEEKKVELEENKEEPEKTEVEKEVEKETIEVEEKKLESERIDKEKEVEKIEKEKEVSSTDDKIKKMVAKQKKHASGEDKLESAEALVKEAKSKDKEVEEVENIVANLQKGKGVNPKTNSDEVPSATELAARAKKK